MAAAGCQRERAPDRLCGRTTRVFLATGRGWMGFKSDEEPPEGIPPITYSLWNPP